MVVNTANQRDPHKAVLHFNRWISIPKSTDEIETLKEDGAPQLTWNLFQIPGYLMNVTPADIKRF